MCSLAKRRKQANSKINALIFNESPAKILYSTPSNSLLPLSIWFFKEYLDIMVLGESTCPFYPLIPYFQSQELLPFNTTIYKVSKPPCPFAFWSSPLFLSWPAPGRHTINTTSQRWWFLALSICPFPLLGIPLQDTAHPGEINAASYLVLLLIQTR